MITVNRFPLMIIRSITISTFHNDHVITRRTESSALIVDATNFVLAAYGFETCLSAFGELGLPRLGDAGTST